MPPIRYRCHHCGESTPYYAQAQRHAYEQHHGRIGMSAQELSQESPALRIAVGGTSGLRRGEARTTEVSAHHPNG